MSTRIHLCSLLIFEKRISYINNGEFFHVIVSSVAHPKEALLALTERQVLTAGEKTNVGNCGKI